MTSMRQMVKRIRCGGLTSGRGKKHDEVIVRKCEGEDDLIGALCELATSVAYGLKDGDTYQPAYNAQRRKHLDDLDGDAGWIGNALNALEECR